jgi:glycosyltransferase involved in cell wall biosynthesis
VRILFLSPRQCWPALSGAKLREYHLARALSGRAELTYVYFAEAGEEALTAKELPFATRIVAVPKPRVYGAWNLMRGIAGKWPLPVLGYTSREMVRALARLDSGQGYDLVHLDSIHMFRYVAALEGILGKAPRVTYDWHNIESEAMRRFAESTSSTARRIYANVTARKLAALEREILEGAFGHVVCSEREGIQLQAIAPRARIAVVENGVDCGYFSERSTTDRRRIVYVGKMDYYPNVEAVVQFAHNTWPMVRDQMKGVTLTIVGASPTVAVEALAQIRGIEVTGTVPDVRPYYREALASVVPLRTGGGTRLKILEAMAAGVPVVSSALGAEGLTVSPGRDILIADPDDAQGWVARLMELQLEERREQITARALELVQTRYDWTILGQSLIETYEGWLRNPG